MALNTQKVITGGIVAGIVLTGLDFLVNGLILAEQNRAAMEAINPAFLENMEGTAAMISYIAIDLVMGVLLVWTYAAIRPRFGAGPKTAVIAGAQVWFIAMLMYTFLTMVGMFTWRYFFIGGVTAFIMFAVAAVAGAMLYKEESQSA
jgi:hypothetical protein